MFGLLVIGSLWFWVLVALVVVIEFFMVEYENPTAATFTLIGAFVLLAIFGDFNLWHAVRSNPVEAGIAGASYFLLGAVWSVGKWWFYVKDLYSQYQEARAKFMQDHGKNANELMGDTLKDMWKKSYSSMHLSKPKIREHKGRIMVWMTYWPWSMVWTVVNDPVKKIFAAIFKELQGLYQKIADSVYKDAERDV